MEKKEFERQMSDLKYEEDIYKFYKGEVIKIIDEIVKEKSGVVNKSIEIKIFSISNIPELFGVSNFLSKMFFSKEINPILERNNMIRSYNILYDYIKK